MNLVLLITSVLFSTLSHSIELSCGPNTYYRERVDLPDGSVLFRDPGLYSNESSYRLSAKSESPCLMMFDKTTEVSRGINYKGLLVPLVTIGNGKFYFSPASSYESIITEVVCK